MEEESEIHAPLKNKEVVVVDELSTDDYYEEISSEIGKDVIAEKPEVNNPTVGNKQLPQISGEDRNRQ